MSKTMAAGLLALGVLGVVGIPSALSVDADAIDKAVARGVAHVRTLQGDKGTWPHPEMGATALAGLTLLECGAAADDDAVARAARAVRQSSIACTHTYSLALAILFLDRLGDSADVPLIESMAVRLLAGQDGGGGWSYQCPPISADEVRRLTALLGDRKPPGERRDPPRAGKRTAEDLPREIRQQLALLDPKGAPRPAFAGDNSNTQFAVLALWVARRHGLPIENALTRIETRFRTTQRPDGGWGYYPPGRETDDPLANTSPTMTCVGVLGLAVIHGAAADAAEGKPRAIEKDRALAVGLAALSTVVDQPGGDGRSGPIRRAGGTSYCFLWSLERTCVALDLETLNKKDWYAWGAEILLANQQADGSWKGSYADCGADTCFALLFLKRANLTRDLTARVKGKLKDPAEAVLKAGGLGGEGLKKSPVRLKPAIEPPRPREDTPAARLSEDLVKAPQAEQGAFLEKLRDGKGVEYTEALTAAIPRLGPEARQKARDALAQRLARMKAETLKQYLRDEELEIRRAAALACAAKGLKDAIPHLIPLLNDREAPVAQGAHAALKALSGQDLGATPDAWEAWWKKQGKE